jgi:hypothetical protein
MGRINPDLGVMNLNVRLQLSRPSGFFDSGDHFDLEISDEASALTIGEIHIPIEAFADLMSMTSTKGTMEYYGKNENIGKKLETQRVILENVEWDIKHVRKCAKEWEKIHSRDGWKIDSYCTDSWNSHCYNNHEYEVIARRWIEE